MHTISDYFRILLFDAFNLGICFRKQKKLQKSLQYFKVALELASTNKKNRSYLMCNIANLYLDMGIYDLSASYFNKTLDSFSETEDISTKIYSLEGIGRLSLKKGEKDEAISYFKIALKIASEQKQLHNVTNCNTLIGKTYAELGKYDDALNYLNEALYMAQRYRYEELSLEALKELQSVYYQKKRPRKGISIS